MSYIKKFKWNKLGTLRTFINYKKKFTDPKIINYNLINIIYTNQLRKKNTDQFYRKINLLKKKLAQESLMLVLLDIKKKIIINGTEDFIILNILW